MVCAPSARALAWVVALCILCTSLSLAMEREARSMAVRGAEGRLRRALSLRDASSDSDAALALLQLSAASTDSVDVADSATSERKRRKKRKRKFTVKLPRGGGGAVGGGARDDLDRQQIERMKRLQRRIPRLARIGVPSCPSFPWCYSIPIPPPTNLPPPDVPLPFLNAPGGSPGGGAGESSGSQSE